MPGSGIWWIQYFDGRGRRRREKVGSKSAAISLYQSRKTAVREGRKLPDKLRSVVCVSDLAPALLRDYRINNKKSYAWAERRLSKHVLKFFGSLPADEVGTDDLNRYIDARKETGAENATINRELAALKRMYNLARAATPPKVRQVPVIPRLEENPPRQGFVDDRQYDLLREHAAELWLRALLALGYTYGFREAELLLLKVCQVNLRERTITLNAGNTKNNEGRIVTMTAEVYELMRQLIDGKAASEFVFTRAHGKPVRDFRGTWWALCEKANLGNFEKDKDAKDHWQGLLFHDLRRSAIRNMIRRGVSENVAMKISGHKTRSVFDRYNIVNDSDLRDAALKIERGREREAEPTATITATKPKTEKRGGQVTADNIQYVQ